MAPFINNPNSESNIAPLETPVESGDPLTFAGIVLDGCGEYPMYCDNSDLADAIDPTKQETKQWQKLEHSGTVPRSGNFTDKSYTFPYILPKEDLLTESNTAARLSSAASPKQNQSRLNCSVFIPIRIN